MILLTFLVVSMIVRKFLEKDKEKISRMKRIEIRIDWRL